VPAVIPRLAPPPRTCSMEVAEDASHPGHSGKYCPRCLKADSIVPRKRYKRAPPRPFCTACQTYTRSCRSKPHVRTWGGGLSDSDIRVETPYDVDWPEHAHEAGEHALSWKWDLSRLSARTARCRSKSPPAGPRMPRESTCQACQGVAVITEYKLWLGPPLRGCQACNASGRLDELVMGRHLEWSYHIPVDPSPEPAMLRDPAEAHKWRPQPTLRQDMAEQPPTLGPIPYLCYGPWSTVGGVLWLQVGFVAQLLSNKPALPHPSYTFRQALASGKMKLFWSQAEDNVDSRRAAVPAQVMYCSWLSLPPSWRTAPPPPQPHPADPTLFPCWGIWVQDDQDRWLSLMPRDLRKSMWPPMPPHTYQIDQAAMSAELGMFWGVRLQSIGRPVRVTTCFEAQGPIDSTMVDTDPLTGLRFLKQAMGSDAPRPTYGPEPYLCIGPWREGEYQCWAELPMLSRRLNCPFELPPTGFGLAQATESGEVRLFWSQPERAILPSATPLIDRVVVRRVNPRLRPIPARLRPSAGRPGHSMHPCYGPWVEGHIIRWLGFPHAVLPPHLWPPMPDPGYRLRQALLNPLPSLFWGSADQAFESPGCPDPLADVRLQLAPLAAHYDSTITPDRCFGPYQGEALTSSPPLSLAVLPASGEPVMPPPGFCLEDALGTGRVTTFWSHRLPGTPAPGVVLTPSMKQILAGLTAPPHGPQPHPCYGVWLSGDRVRYLAFQSLRLKGLRPAHLLPTAEQALARGRPGWYQVPHVSAQYTAGQTEKPYVREPLPPRPPGPRVLKPALRPVSPYATSEDEAPSDVSTRPPTVASGSGSGGGAPGATGAPARLLQSWEVLGPIWTDRIFPCWGVLELSQPQPADSPFWLEFHPTVLRSDLTPIMPQDMCHGLLEARRTGELKWFYSQTSPYRPRPGDPAVFEHDPKGKFCTGSSVPLGAMPYPCFGVVKVDGVLGWVAFPPSILDYGLSMPARTVQLDTAMRLRTKPMLFWPTRVRPASQCKPTPVSPPSPVPEPVSPPPPPVQHPSPQGEAGSGSAQTSSRRSRRQRKLTSASAGGAFAQGPLVCTPLSPGISMPPGAGSSTPVLETPTVVPPLTPGPSGAQLAPGAKASCPSAGTGAGAVPPQGAGAPDDQDPTPEDQGAEDQDPASPAQDPASPAQDPASPAQDPASPAQDPAQVPAPPDPSPPVASAPPPHTAGPWFARPGLEQSTLRHLAAWLWMQQTTRPDPALPAKYLPSGARD